MSVWRRPRSGRLATADAHLPSLSYGHLVGDSTGPARRGQPTVNGASRCAHLPGQRIDLARANRLLRSRRFQYSELAVAGLRGFCIVAVATVRSVLLLLPKLSSKLLWNHVDSATIAFPVAVGQMVGAGFWARRRGAGLAVVRSDWPPSRPFQAPVAAIWWLWSFNRLWVAASNRHSESTAERPRRRKRWNPRLCLTCPNTGSTVAIRLR